MVRKHSTTEKKTDNFIATEKGKSGQVLFYLHHRKKLGELGLSSDSPLLFGSCLFHNDTAETKNDAI